MPRDANGNYTLPAGNPVISGTIIDTGWANPTMQDIGNELTNSLSREGEGGMLVPFKFTDGAVATPSITFTSETTTGIYRAGLSDIRVSVGGVDIFRWTASGVQVWNAIDLVWEDLAIGADYLPLTGGTVTGQIVTIPPLAAGDAANKGYVDEVNVQNVKVTGDQGIAGLKTFASNVAITELLPTDISHATRKDYVDGEIAAIPTDFLPLVGGTVTGQVKGIAPIANEDLTRKDYVDSVAGIAQPKAGTINIVGGGTGVVAFVTPFPDQNYSVVANSIGAVPAGAQAIQISNKSSGGMNLFNSNGSALDVNWVASAYNNS